MTANDVTALDGPIERMHASRRNLLSSLGIKDIDSICGDVIIRVPLNGYPKVEVTYRMHEYEARRKFFVVDAIYER